MADITRTAAVTLTNQMLRKYKKAINVCQEDKSVLTPEATKIVNDYESNGLEKIITKVLSDESYFDNYDNKELYAFFSNLRELLKKCGLNPGNDIILVTGVTDNGILKLKTPGQPVKVGQKIVYKVMKGNDELDNLFTRERFTIEWELEKTENQDSQLTDDKVEKSLFKDTLENDSILFNQFDRSFTISEPGKYKVSANIYEKDLWGRKELVDIVSYEQVVEDNSLQSSTESWKVYLDKDNKIIKIEYGSDKKKALIINSKGKLIKKVEMVGKDYDGKGFAKKLLTAAGLEATSKADLELQNFMLDNGLFYINKEEGWVEKEKYFERMTPKDFLEIQDYKDVTVKAVYDDNKGELTFTYTVGGKTENLFVIKATNRQKEREYPSKSGNQFDSKKADPSNIYGGYIPGKFPKGTWNITLFKEINDTEYGPYKIRTDAYRYVEAWDYVFDEDLDKKLWKKRLDKDGNVVKIKDEGLLIHGGGYSESDLDNRKGSNKYTDSTLGCIRISNLDVYLIVETLQEYLDTKKLIQLEVK